MRSIHERFWSKAATGPIAKCWPWIAGRNLQGYGRFKREGRTGAAHRVAWELAWLDRVPAGMDVLHHCDNPPCVNPAHLFLGTQTDNMRDMVEKGRQAIGAAHGRAKLTNEQVRDIRIRVAAGETQKAIAAVFAVSKSLVWYIVHHKNWSHVS